MAMTDDERIIEALAKSRVKGVDKQDWNSTTYNNRSWHIKAAGLQLAALRALGGDVTMPPAPEPTYTIRLSEKQRGMVVASVISKNNPRWSESQEGEDAWDELYEMIISTLPDQEPGA